MESFIKLKWGWKRCNDTSLEKFNATFSDHKDVFFCHLNEIDTIHNHDFAEEGNEKSDCLCVDPRNQMIVHNNVIISEDIVESPSIFKFFPTKSKLTANEHSLCLNVLLSLQNRSSLDENHDDDGSIAKFNNLRGKISEENKRYNEFVKNYFLSNNMFRKKEVDPNLFRLFVHKWKWEVDQFLKQLSQHHYVLATAIPLNFGKSQVDINLKFSSDNYNEIQHLCTKTVYSCNTIKHRIKGAQYHLEKYYTELVQKNETTNDLPNEDLNVDIIIPIESLLCLLQGFYENDDWMLPISITDKDRIKQIVIGNSLPRTKIGSIMRNNSIALDIIKAVSTKNTSYDDKEVKFKNNHSDYQIRHFDQYMMEYNTKHKRTVSGDKLTHNVVDTFRDNESLSMMVSCSAHAVDDNKLLIFSTKLEYQPEFGEEQMSLFELIREWVYLKFINHIKVDRIHMHYSSYAILSARQITLDAVTEEIHRLYNIEEQELLNSVFQIILMLKGFPAATYLGKHDPMKKGRIYVYQHSDQKETISESTSLNLGELYSDVNFNVSNLDELSWTPINLTGVTDVHIKSKIAPGLFSYCNNNFSRIIKDRPKSVKKRIIDKKPRKKKFKSKWKKQSIPKCSKQTDSVDPKQMFDKSGNVNILNLLYCNIKHF